MSDAPIPAENNQNPFDTSMGLIPFAGRETELSTLHQHLTDAKNTHASLYIGRWRSGKTALLKNFDTFFDKAFIGIYIPLNQVEFSDDDAWIMTLFQAVDYYIKQRGITQSQQLTAPQEDDNLREWFKDTFLPNAFRTIRPQRRLALLFDDIQCLIEAVDNDVLAEDTFVYLHSLMDTQLGMALTLPVEYEDHVEKLIPLIEATKVQRLSNLTIEACKTLYRNSLPTLEITSIERIHASSGGNPFLLQRFGYHLHEGLQSSNSQSELITTVHTTINREQHDYFLTIWKSLSQNERFVLTALSGLLYDDPIKQITPTTIENWLVETEYLMDTTAINAVLRSLEYREIVRLQGGKIQFVANLMRDWIIEHAQINVSATSTENQAPKLVVWALVILFIVVLLGLLVVISDSGTDNNRSQATIVPTVTLVPQSNN